MAGKRQATSDLNHDNWDREEEPEERGIFRTATEDELKNRVIKKAKRKIATDSDAGDSGSATKSIFSGFTGFGKPTPFGTAPPNSPFCFLNKIPAVAAAASGAVSSSTTTSSGTTPKLSLGSGLAVEAKSTESSKSFSFGNSSNNVVPLDAKLQSKMEVGNSEYHKQLSSLNQAVCEWIKTHVDKNPVCILSPIFKDYENYLKEIENIKKNVEFNEKSSQNADTGEKSITATGKGSFKFNSTNDSGSTPKTGATETKSNGFTYDIKKQETLSDKPATAANFSFSLKPSAPTSTTTTTSTTPSFSFGNLPNSNSQSNAASKPFSFNPGSTPFSFGNIKPPEVSASAPLDSEQNEEDEEPPKNDFKLVVEDDAIYSKKCKVFVKKEGQFVDKGVGTLYLKPVESSNKTQLLVRADTNLGNILVNLILSSAIPAQRMGKNNVMMVCLPTPDAEKPTSMLLRVKTGEEADELLENIEKYKH